MNTSTIAIDLAKDVFQLAISDVAGRVMERHRLTRSRFSRFFDNRLPCTVVMEACGSAHYWARRLQALGFSVVLLPAHYTRAYVRGNKTDKADAAGLLEAFRCADLQPVPIKTPRQQGVQGLHRIREHAKAQRTAAINLVRGLLREFGILIPAGAAKVRPCVLAALEDGDNQLPMALRHTLADLLGEIAGLQERMQRIEKRLVEFAQTDGLSQRVQQAPGIGVITGTAISASVGSLSRFPSGRHFSAWLGITPREHSSGRQRRLGRMSKRGDTYLRMLIIHGARSVLRSAMVQEKQGQILDHLHAWALALSRRQGYNKAAVALANKLARRLWAMEHHGVPFDANHLSSRPRPSQEMAIAA